MSLLRRFSGPQAQPTDLPVSPKLNRRDSLRWLLGGLGLSMGGLAGCETATTETAWLRVVNATTNYTTADFWVEGSLAVSSLSQGGTASAWLEVEAGDVQVSLRAAGGSSDKFSSSHSYDSDSSTTLVALGSLGSSTDALTFKYLPETTSAPASGLVKVRALHACGGQGPLNVYLTDTEASASDLADLDPLADTTVLEAMGSLGGFSSVDAGTLWRVWVTSEDGTLLFASHVDGFSLGGGSVVTLVVAPPGPTVGVLVQQSSSLVLANYA
ncbi:DUF4397 domain-containing protein [Ideonella livida]|uniref:DUF4397 domain-containing protein n=1 Tax=Ideonella livida TaxID=2707176 RepID=A0A7C9PIE9_9BURK|nr:DUF4397 domain-containing protein [Ideonella livida]NDY92716.1 DUF4397 domain-containing protein [Ideonella livida]